MTTHATLSGKRTEDREEGCALSFFLMVLAGIVLVWSMVWGARWAMGNRRLRTGGPDRTGGNSPDAVGFGPRAEGRTDVAASPEAVRTVTDPLEKSVHQIDSDLPAEAVQAAAPPHAETAPTNPSLPGRPGARPALQGDQTADPPSLWPDRTGERTKQELGARDGAPDRGAHAPIPGPAVAPPEGGWPVDARETPPTDQP